MRTAILFLIVLIFVSGCSKINQACANGKCFKLEIADTNEERSTGLMNHESLQEDAGMWFVFDKDDKHLFWMKDMKFPIDIIWIDSNYNVVDIKRDARPCKDDCEIYSPSKEVRYVLEVNAGSNINAGNKVEIK